jgi:hypothetical protein
VSEKRHSDHFFWRELAVVSLLNDTSLTADFMAQFLKQRENNDALKFKKNQTFN